MIVSLVSAVQLVAKDSSIRSCTSIFLVEFGERGVIESVHSDPVLMKVVISSATATTYVQYQNLRAFFYPAI